MPNSGMPRATQASDKRQREVVAMDIVGFMPCVRLGLEPRRMNIGAGAGQHDAVDGIQQRPDIGDLG